MVRNTLAGEGVHEPSDGDADQNEKGEGPEGILDAASGGASREETDRDGDERGEDQ